MSKAILIEANSNVRRIDVNDYADFVENVGGRIESIALGDTGQLGYLNEYGIELGLPYNKVATDLCHKLNVNLTPGDYIKGNMIIIGPGDYDVDHTDVSAALAAELGV